MKTVSPEMWREIERVCQHAQIDADFETRKGLIRAGQKFGFTEAELIEANIIQQTQDALKTPRVGSRLGARRR